MAAKTQDAAASTGESSAKSDAVQVAVRVRPLSTSEASQGSKACVQVEDASILLAEKRFHFDAVFSATTQQEIVYTTLVAPMVDKFFCGYNATVFAYGQTGSGKTFTMGNDFGSSGARNDRGVIPRVIESVFEKINASRNSQHFVVKLSYLEILNEEIHDLFPKFSTDKLRQTLSVRGDGDRGIIVHGLREHVVNSADKALELLRSGALLRATAATCMNGKSSRSHAICTIAMEYREVIAVEGVRETRYSKFHLVDLAGSERVRRTNTQGARFKEGVSINRGLLALGNVINALSERCRSAHVPYRDSKLTRLLQDSLGGNSKTLMIACVSPADVNQEETTNSLRYASRSRNIENQAIINTDRSAVNGLLVPVRTDEPHSNAISSLEEENRKLTEELCLAKEAKDKWKKIAEKLDAKLEKTVKELQDFKDQATKQKPAKKRIKRESYETMETFFSSSDEEDDNIQADPDYVSDEHRSTKRKKVNSTTSLTGDVMDEIDELLETSAASCCSCHGKCATKACACKSQSRVCSDTCSCNSENCRNRHMGDTPGGVNLHKGNADLAAPSTPTRPNAPEAFVSTGPAVGNDTAIDLMSP
ncbi:hypothetical protein PC110_g6475 [Phytophthora cactorum]|uniref:Kinesin-like protein n=1 Tax=Phytophthora cactorum TaxID=29920 RepID=A0A329SKQ2_9STRA|nr:hypothetical protein PC114_g3240 [Phytophthora cactorum]KAG3101313.1 hypothetical protein PC122_g2752 [Phytophthora cactorum]RAW37255.1 hypothetical protein PC110_g6475 [Phytophthora cactorum]